MTLVERLRKWAKHYPYIESPELIDAAIEAADALSARPEALRSDALLKAVREWVYARATSEPFELLVAEHNLNEAFRKAVDLGSSAGIPVGQTCDKCGQRTAMHTINFGGKETHQCCDCYVADGNPPADWHRACMRAYCPSVKVFDGNGKQDGWMYAIHIRPHGDTRTECQTCGLKFSVPPSAVSPRGKQ